MAVRPVFIPGDRIGALVQIRSVDFTWHPGLAPSQKRKSIASLHDAVQRARLASSPLEISTKSPDAIGIALSAFNLRFRSPGWPDCTVESAFQASKVFEGGGPFQDIAGMAPANAKRDPRLRSSGPLIAFEFGMRRWPLQPTTLFYDWLYICALARNPDMARRVVQHDAFTDIEFNPESSLNCQARSAAAFVAISRLGFTDDVAGDHHRLEAILRCAGRDETAAQGSLSL